MIRDDLLALDCQDKIDVLQDRLDALLGVPSGRLPPLANLTDDDLEKLTSDDLENFDDDQLFVIGSRLRARYERSTGRKIERPLLTPEELSHMNGEQLAALEARLRVEPHV
jgi:hypothetical protein